VNARTAKLISRFASRTTQKARTLKREWQTLSRKAKTERRAKMKAAVD